MAKLANRYGPGDANWLTPDDDASCEIHASTPLKLSRQFDESNREDQSNNARFGRWMWHRRCGKLLGFKMAECEGKALGELT